MNAVTAEERVRTSHLDGRRALRGLTLASWSAFFVWLWTSGEASRYLGPRTMWVIPFGALTLGGAALLHALTIRSTRRSRPSVMEVTGSVVLLIPMLAVAVVPSADLGTLASSRKSTGNAPLAEELAVSAGVVEDPKFREIAYAEESEDYANAIGVTEGMNVDLLGFVDDSGAGPDGTLTLTRFYVSCCAADAVPYSVAVDPNGQTSAAEADSWVEASGVLERREDGFVLLAKSFEVVSEPQDPYLY